MVNKWYLVLVGIVVNTRSIPVSRNSGQQKTNTGLSQGPATQMISQYLSVARNCHRNWDLNHSPIKCMIIFTETISLNLSNLLVISVTRNQSSAVDRNICAVVSILTPWTGGGGGGGGLNCKNKSQSMQFHNFLGGKSQAWLVTIPLGHRIFTFNRPGHAAENVQLLLARSGDKISF